MSGLLRGPSVRCSELDLHAIRFGGLRQPVDRSEVCFSCILRPHELKPPQQSHHKEEELHTSQSFSETDARPCSLKRPQTHDADPTCFFLTWSYKRELNMNIPAEKGINASGLTNSPLALRKFSGLNSRGDFHRPSSNSTDDRLGMTVVPWRTQKQHSHMCPCFWFLQSSKLWSNFFIFTLGMEYPINSVSLVVRWKTLRGTVFAILWTSWITACTTNTLH